jgi:hypothetical protein
MTVKIGSKTKAQQNAGYSVEVYSLCQVNGGTNLTGLAIKKQQTKY